MSLKTVIPYYTTVGTSKLTSVTVHTFNLCDTAQWPAVGSVGTECYSWVITLCFAALCPIRSSGSCELCEHPVDAPERVVVRHWCIRWEWQ